VTTIRTPPAILSARGSGSVVELRTTTQEDLMSQSRMAVVYAAAFLLLAMDVSGCTCMHQKVGPPCLTANKASAIFTGTVTKVVQGQYGPPLRPTVATIRTDRWYRGKEAAVVKVSTHSVSSMCGFTFAEGQRLVVFATGAEGAYSTDSCTPTGPIQAAAPILDYLEPLGRALKTRFEGSWVAGSLAPVQGEIVLRGPAEVKLRSNARGLFSVNDLPRGRYKVTFRPLQTGLTTPPEQTVALSDGNCTSLLVRSCAGGDCVPPRVTTTPFPK
jgi:hypothetical protein